MADHVYILGVPNFANYESSAALIRVPRDGGPIDYVCIGEDRLTRVKHTYMFPLRGIHYCLRHFGLERLDQVDWIATDYARIPRWLNSGPAYRKLEHDYLKLMLDYPRERILVLDHHDAHAASCYYPSGFDEAGVLIVDGMGSELNTQTAYHFEGDRITWQERGYDWGIGRAYAFVTGSVLPYGPEKGYGKVMGLAGYGRDRAGAEPVLDFRVRDEGMTTDYSGFYSRYPLSRLVAKGVPYCDDRTRVMEDPFPRAAFEVQQECERQLVRMARYVHEKTGTRRLCISGGVALNGRANYRILKDTPIEEVWIQPACSDTGIPFGLALWAHKQVVPLPEGRRTSVAMPHAYCGSPHPESEIDALLARHGIETEPTGPEEIARLLADGRIVAYYEGGSEFGPRALGHRSILADPRDPDMKDRLNRSVKFREPYRPYAPVVLLERANEYFDLPCPSPFMLLVADVRPERAHEIPAVDHVDHTARVQTVTAEDNGTYYEIVKAFGELTGVPVLLDTSFNVNREPIVETPLDALICAFGTSIDHLVIEGRRVDCAAHRDPELVRQLTEERQAALDAEYERVKERYLLGFDPQERDVYLEQENRIAEWYRDHRAKYELEQAIAAWRRDDARVLVVGSRAHAKCVYLYVPEMPAVRVVGFVPCDERMGERGEFDGVWPETTLDAVDWSEVDAVFVCSHEYQRPLEAAVRAAAPAGMPVHTIYDTACDSLIYTLPGKWPVANPEEAARHGLSMRALAQRTASNIDFDFEPSAIDVGDRFAVVINYHWIRPPGGTTAFEPPHAVDPRRLDEQLAALRESFQLCRARDLVDPDAELPESNVVITVDDGLADVVHHALPVLRRHGATATFYVSALPYVEQRVLMVQKIQLLHAKLGLGRFRAAFGEELARQRPGGFEPDAMDYARGVRFYPYDDEAVRAFKLDLNYRIPYEVVEPVLERLFLETFGLASEKEAVPHLYVALDDLSRLVDEGFEIGIHGYDHHVLPRLDYLQQRRNLESTVDWLAPITGRRDLTVSYPHGFSNVHTKRAMKELGLAAGFALGRRMVQPRDLEARWQIPRFDVNDCFDREKNQIRYEVFSALSTGD